MNTSTGLSLTVTHRLRITFLYQQGPDLIPRVLVRIHVGERWVYCLPSFYTLRECAYWYWYTYPLSVLLVLALLIAPVASIGRF